MKHLFLMIYFDSSKNYQNELNENKNSGSYLLILFKLKIRNNKLITLKLIKREYKR